MASASRLPPKVAARLADAHFAREGGSPKINARYQIGEGQVDMVLEKVSRDGATRRQLGAPAEYFNGGSPTISPDGTRALVVTWTCAAGIGDVWQVDLASGTR